jgi:mannose-6-phosphate isomerase-like protein (cupin superfamily)
MWFESENTMLSKVNVIEKFSAIPDYWNPRIIGELNGQYVKAAKFKGQFDWHFHEGEDELFWVVRGQMGMGLRDPTERAVVVDEGEILVVPKGVEHRPSAVTDEAWIVMFEPKTTLNTGNLRNEKTRTELEQL